MFTLENLLIAVPRVVCLLSCCTCRDGPKQWLMSLSCAQGDESELDAIRQRRVAELMSQYGGGQEVNTCSGSCLLTSRDFVEQTKTDTCLSQGGEQVTPEARQQQVGRVFALFVICLRNVGARFCSSPCLINRKRSKRRKRSKDRACWRE